MAEHNHHRPGAHSAPVLDIGGEVGALVVYLASRPSTGELEACPAGQPAARFHTGVHRRTTPNGRTWTALFPEVTEGPYELLDEDGVPMAGVDVTGGNVHELDLR
ncbi:MAG TPA: hypothetical protein VKD21_07155 [Acidimicrobiales bacterium]|nr:hypothetical protein [Acidimicrobiales bacterium]